MDSYRRLRLSLPLLAFALMLFLGGRLAKAAAVTSPVPGTTLPSSSVTFTWTAGAGRYFLYVGTSAGKNNIASIGYLAPGTLSASVTGIPTNAPVYVRLWSETSLNSGSFYTYDYIYNSDLDNDSILDVIDPHPGSADAMRTLSGADYTLKILGSGRVACMESATLFNNTSVEMDGTEAQSISQRIYAQFKDDFDFILVASNQTSGTGPYAGIFYGTRNDIQGLGKSTYNATASYGSAGKLQGIIHLSTTDALTGGPSLHELAHRWANSLRSVPSAVGGHWGYCSAGGQLGGWQPGSLEGLGGSTYRAKNPRSGAYGSWGSFANGGNGLPYSELELYTMGLIDAGEVANNIQIANGFTWLDSVSGTFTATSITDVTMAQVVATDGVRTPGKASSQKSFRVLYLILAPSALTTSQWQDFDEAVYKFALQGDNGSSLYNFWEATGGRASLVMNGLLDSLIVPTLGSFTLVETPTRLVRLQIVSAVGKTYTLQYSTDLIVWNDGASTAGSGATLTFDYPINNTPALFFRIKID